MREAHRHGAGSASGRRGVWGDVIAGVSVALVLIPQALAYAELAGLPPHAGLYAAALPPIAAALFASSPYLQTGPVAVTALLAFGALSPHAPPGSPEYVQLGTLLALIVGAVRVGIGLLGAGRIAYFISEPVLRGFTTGAALLIIAAQIPGVLGLPPADGVLLSAWSALVGVTRWEPGAIGIAVLSLLLIMGGLRIHPLVPGILLAVIAGMVFSRLGYAVGPTLGPLPAGLPPLTLGQPWGALPSLVLSGVIIALVGFAEAASIARFFAARERQVWRPGRDFVAQGAANLAAGLTGGFPVGGSFSRSSLNHMLGARTRWSGAITGLSVLVFLPFAPLLAPLPRAVLSAVVIAAVVGLVRVRAILALWPISRTQFLVSASTLGLTLALSPHIEHAVALGIALAIGVHLWRELRVEVESWVEAETLHIKPRGVLWFGSAEALKGKILKLVGNHPDARRLIIHAGGLGRVDISGALVIADILAGAREAGLSVGLRGVQPRTARALRAVLLKRPRAKRIRTTRKED